MSFPRLITRRSSSRTARCLPCMLHMPPYAWRFTVHKYANHNHVYCARNAPCAWRSSHVCCARARQAPRAWRLLFVAHALRVRCPVKDMHRVHRELGVMGPDWKIYISTNSYHYVMAFRHDGSSYNYCSSLLYKCWKIQKIYKFYKKKKKKNDYASMIPASGTFKIFGKSISNVQ